MISRLTVACALALGLLTFAATAQAAPPDFTWSSNVSTTQAGGHPNLTLSYASSSTQSLTRLDVDLPEGLMHRNNLSGACSNPLYLADNCPASSTIGTVSTQIVIARIPVSVPGTIYQLSAPTDDAAATFGIVLRPPLSGLGLTRKIFIRNQINFTNGGGLRSSLVGPLNTVNFLGATLPSRISQLRLTYNSQTPTGGIALINNPTSCKLQTIRGVGTYSDGDKRGQDSSFTTTGCAAVPFAPSTDVQFSNFTAGAKTAALVAMANPGGGSSSALHPGHVRDFWNDWEDVLLFDLDAISSGPLCTDEQAAASACPAESQFGEFSVDIEGFGTATGKSFVTNSPGHKTVNEITLRQGVTVSFPGEIGRSSLSFSGLPQLPFTAIRFKTTKEAAWITNTCAIRTSRTSSTSWGDGHSVDQNVHGAPACTPPAAPTITDGPDRGITINTSHVEYRFSGKEVDTAWECETDFGPYEACSSPFVDDFQGEGAHSFSVRGVRGGLTGPATTATFSIDTIPPEVTFVGDEYADKDGDGIADQPFRTDDFEYTFNAIDSGSGLNFDKLDASFVSEARPQEPSTRSVKQPRPHTQGHVQVGGPALAPPGPGTATATAVDLAGNATTIAIGLIIDVSPPKIAIKEQGVRYSDAASPEIEFVAEDDSLRYAQGELEYSCERKGWDGTVKGGSSKIITDRDTGRSKGFCTFEGTPEGKFQVIVRGWDPVKKEGVAEGELIVDRSPPEIKFVNPEDADADGDGFADSRFRPASFDVFTELSDEGSGVDPEGSQCRAKGIVKGIPTTTPTPVGMTCSFEGLADGDVEVEFSARNYVGTVTIVKRSFTVDTTGPTLSFTDTGDLDSDGDGFSDNRVRAARLGYEILVDDGRGIGVDPASGACDAKPRKGGVITGTVIINNGNLRCSFEDLPGGDTDIEIRAADYRGHVTVLKAAVTIEGNPPPTPVLTITAPVSGQTIAQGSNMTIGHTIVGIGPFTYRCAIDNVVVLASCPSGSSVSTAGMGGGAHTLKVIAYDAAGSYEATRAFNISTGGNPPDVCIAIYPPPAGCPGYVPPGGGGVITFP